MAIFQPITTQAALGVNTGAASNVGSSEFVRLHNTAATDKLFAGNAAVLACGVSLCSIRKKV